MRLRSSVAFGRCYEGDGKVIRQRVEAEASEVFPVLELKGKRRRSFAVRHTGSGE